MSAHSHEFVEDYKGLVGFGLDRETNENTIIYYLQKFSDDALMADLVKRLGDEDLEKLFFTISDLLGKYLTEPEYHRLFLKDDSHRDVPSG
jgi:hypothetical protein